MLSNTKRKARRRLLQYNEYWDLAATKAMLLGDAAVQACVDGWPLVVRESDGVIESLERAINRARAVGKGDFKHSIDPAEWLLGKMKLKPNAANCKRLRNALLRIRTEPVL